MKKWQEGLLNILTSKGFSEFEVAVYKATMQIPRGKTKSYSQIAKRIKRPRAIRAVANALAKNPLPLVIPCHRVIRKDGGLGGYSWGKIEKEKLLRLEKKSLKKSK